MMKQSSRRSKDVLKSTIDPKKSITDYHEYEQQLASYQQGSKANIANLFDWSKPSEVISLKSAQPSHPSQPSRQLKEEPIQNHSMNTEELLRSQGDPKQKHGEEYLDDSFEVDSPNIPSKPTFVDRIQQNYGNQYRNMSSGELETELKKMREQMITMNIKLNAMMDRYQLMAQPIQREVVISNPHHFLTKQIEINAKILSKQAEEIRHIQEKDRELQKKDYLVELNELIIEIRKEIHDTGKEKHTRWVDVERIDRLLKELEDIQGTEEQYRQVKELKIKIVYYFKKLKEQKIEEEQLDLELQKLVVKDNQITKEYEQYMQLAVQNSLEVSTNKKYLQIKKRYDQLIVLRESSRKKKDIAVKFQLVAEEKAERQIQAMRKEMQRVEALTHQLQTKSAAVDEVTNDFIKKNNVLTKQIKSISYRFDDSLLHSDKQRFKPDFKRMSKIEGGKEVNLTQQMPIEKTSMRLINDKNITVDETSSNTDHLQDSKLKPVLRQWKGKSQKQRYMQSPSAKEYKTLESSNIFRPPMLLRGKK